jgi:hypothetical protein
MSIEITGKKPLFPTFREYLVWIDGHSLELIDKQAAGDEYADIIIKAVIKLHDQGYDSTTNAGIMVCVERYIDRYHPDFAHIPATLKTWEVPNV